MERIDPDYLTKSEVATGARFEDFWFVSEPGLYQVIFRSNKPEAKALLPEFR